MAGAKEFKRLEDLGALPLGETSELRFYVDEFKGHRYGSIRTFVAGDSYSGPTKAGVTLNGRVLDETLPVLEKLPLEPADKEDRELVRVPKKPGVELVVRVTLYKGEAGVDFREWHDEAGFKGWSQKGVRVPYKDLAATIAFLRRMKSLVVKA